MQQLSERRAASREPAKQVAYVTVADRLSAWAVTVDVSETGIFLVTHLPARLHEKVKIEFIAPLEDVALASTMAVVTRITEVGFGLVWVDPDNPVRRHLMAPTRVSPDPPDRK